MSQASNQESWDSHSGSWLLSPHSRQLYYMSVYKVHRGPVMGQAVLPGLREQAALWKASWGNQACDPAMVSTESPDTPPARAGGSPHAAAGSASEPDSCQRSPSP